MNGLKYLQKFYTLCSSSGSVCEWAYDRQSPIGKLDKGLEQAKLHGWTIVDMKNDWKTVFIN